MRKEKLHSDEYIIFRTTASNAAFFKDYHSYEGLTSTLFNLNQQYGVRLSEIRLRLLLDKLPKNCLGTC